LSNQINPHFLFNTLTSISSLIRTQPDTARMLITKLSGLLRRLMRSTDHFVTLREELESIDQYLDIEVVRFGPQLRVVKDIGPDTLDLIVPSMLLQPLVENSIKHGLSSKVEGGTIRIRTARHESKLSLLVEDDGVGIPESKLATLLDHGGIGVSNVNERLKVLFGSEYRMWIDSQPGRGTRIQIEVPELHTDLAAVS
jgi:two-component system, LytTR family, sensor kinase